jgi:hypothetical protein
MGGNQCAEVTELREKLLLSLSRELVAALDPPRVTATSR